VVSAVKRELRVLELFAGVGGFRGALEGFPGEKLEKAPGYKVVWSNQFEPKTKRQWASEIYASRFGHEGHVNADIESVLASRGSLEQVLSLGADVLVAGFPCQDYSVAKPANLSAGIEGKKGVLWWSIHKLVAAHCQANRPLRYLILENVDRLLSSPAKCRGRDFAIILASLAALGYDVEWRVINAADYGFPQRRRRVFIVARHRGPSIESHPLHDNGAIGNVPPSLLSNTLNRAFPCTAKSRVKSFDIPSNVFEAQALFEKSRSDERPFLNSGVLVDGKVLTQEVKAAEIADFSAFSGQQQAMTLGDVVSATSTESVDASLFLGSAEVSRWTYLKGAKSEPRTSSSGHTYHYKEGPLPFPDPLDRPSRTIITSEGGATASRTKHVVAAPDGRLRRLTPEELEALNGFPRGFTRVDGVSPITRAFVMGNALVAGVVRRIGAALVESDSHLNRPPRQRKPADKGR